MKAHEKITNAICKITKANCEVETLGRGVLRVNIKDNHEEALKALNRRFRVINSFEYNGSTIATVHLF